MLFRRQEAVDTCIGEWARLADQYLRESKLRLRTWECPCDQTEIWSSRVLTGTRLKLGAREWACVQTENRSSGEHT